MPETIRKVIPALDVAELSRIESLLKSVGDDDFIYGYKIGFALGLAFGLPKVVQTIKSISDKPVIYDHQKAATDIPDTGKLFADTMQQSGVDEVILFPQAGPSTMEGWVKAMQENALKVIVGGIMTHAKFVQSEGGYIRDEAVMEIYGKAMQLGVRDFVVPLTKPEATRAVYEQTEMDDTCSFYSPGFGKQGGDPQKFTYLRTHYWIIGRSLLNADNPKNYLDQVKRNTSGITD
ncbi:MAG: hypothetical protein GF313_05960 [Caldithrix sp.]|nr:hypothetical protein [Caldithrix sp.]